MNTQDFCFPRAHRLITQTDFKLVFNGAAKVSSSYLLVLYLPNGKAISRLGLSIAKRAIKTAVQRNLVKRILRESFRQQQSHLKGLDIIILARQGCANLDTAKLRQDIDKLWKKLIISLKKAAPV